MITDQSTSSGLTRRSFIKRSVVAAVAVSSMTIFSGLVRADPEGEGGTATATSTSCTIDTSKGCTNTNDGKNGQGYYCPCTKSSGAIKTMGAKCDDAIGTNPKSLC